MANRLSRIAWACVLTAVVATAGQYCQAQVPLAATQVQQTAVEGKTPANNPPAKELTKRQIDELIEKVFGRASEERQRPIRVWLPSFSMVLAAKEVGDLGGRTVRFRSASAAVVDPDEFESRATVFHGQEIVITLDDVVKQLSELKGRSPSGVEIHDRQTQITLQAGIKSGTDSAGEVVASPPSPPAPTQVTGNAPALATTVVDVPRKVTKSKFSALRLKTRFQFDLRGDGPASKFLPAPPKTQSKPAAWNNEDLAKVPEATFGEPMKPQSEIKAMEETARVLTKINHLNRRQSDGFLHALLAERPDLQGLPFLMGDQCRTREDDARVFAVIASAFHDGLGPVKENLNADALKEAWEGIGETLQSMNATAVMRAMKTSSPQLANASTEQINRAAIAALMQILLPEPEPARLGLAKFLATVPNVEATKALARLALLSPEESVRSAAIAGLKLRRERDYTDVLLQGFRYPLPVVSKRAADALVKLESKDLLMNLIDILEQPDPRLPIVEKRDGKDVSVVRELVRINHHRNCMLCHAPGNSDNTPEGVLRAAVPLPNVPLPKPSEGGGYEDRAAELPDTVVRIDMTYLRQDFSLMMPVSDAHPWPDMQRFDFLVRTRVLTPQEAEVLGKSGTAEEPGRQSPYHRAALYALRELTGRDTEPTAAAWRRLLQTPAPLRP